MIKTLQQFRRSRLSLIFMVLLCLVGTAARAQSQPRNFNIREATVGEAVDQIIAGTPYRVVYSVNDLAAKGRVTAVLTNVTVEDALRDILGRNSLTYTIRDRNTIIISAVQPGQGGARASGVVLDSKGDPLAGVSVLVKGTTQGVRTDAQGRFAITIQNPPARPVLAFSYIGMEPQEVAVSETPLRITMKDSPTAIGEVTVNTGYQVIDERLMGGSYTIVHAKDLAMDGIANLDQMLQGHVPGMLVTSPSSKVGTTAKVSIRGQSTLLGNSDPLWVVDGVTMPNPPKLKDLSGLLLVYGNDLRELAANQISWLNPMDVETVTVLKDASATAIYGANASNGVIVITTKRGKGDGKTNIRVSTDYSVKNAPGYADLDLMNSEEWVNFYTYQKNQGASLKVQALPHGTTLSGVIRQYNNNEIDEEQYRRTVAHFINSNTDWLDLLCRPQFTQNHNLSISGGTSGISYVVSGGYFAEQGQEKGNDNERISLMSGVDFQLGPKVKISTTITGSFTESTGFAVGSPFTYAIETSRAIPAYDEEGELFFYRKKTTYSANDAVTDLAYNAINEWAHNGAKVSGIHVSANLNLQWTIIPDLQYRMNAGIVRRASLEETYAGEQTFRIASDFRGYDYGDPTVVQGDEVDGRWAAAILNKGGIFRMSDGFQSSYNITNSLNYAKTFNEHKINVFGGFDISSSSSRQHENTMYGYMPDRGMGVSAPNQNFKPKSLTGGLSPYLGIFADLYRGGWTAYQPVLNDMSYFVNPSYFYGLKYGVTATVRSDGSNTFGQNVNSRFDPTWAVTGIWNADQEGFIRAIPKLVQQLKFSANFGVRGLSALTGSPDVIFRRGTVSTTTDLEQSKIASQPNPFMSYERTQSWGLNASYYILGFLSGTVAYYESTSQITQNMEVPLEFGVATMNKNGGKLVNKGLELTFNFTPIRTEDVGLNISFNTGRNRNKGRVSSKETFNTKDHLSGSQGQIIEGYPVGAMWAYSFKGFNETTGLPEFNKLDVAENEWGADYDPKKFLVYVGTTTPDLFGGLNLQFRYKSFVLRSNFYLSVGGVTRLPNPYEYGDSGYLPTDEINLSRELLRARKNPGDTSDIPAFFTGKNGSTSKINLPTDEPGTLASWDIYTLWGNSDARVIDNSYFRCTNIRLDWTLKPEWSRAVGLQQVSVNASLSNIFLIANKRLNGYDPEYAIAGIQRTAPKTFTIGVSLSF